MPRRVHRPTNVKRNESNAGDAAAIPAPLARPTLPLRVIGLTHRDPKPPSLPADPFRRSTRDGSGYFTRT